MKGKRNEGFPRFTVLLNVLPDQLACHSEDRNNPMIRSADQKRQVTHRPILASRSICGGSTEALDMCRECSLLHTHSVKQRQTTLSFKSLNFILSNLLYALGRKHTSVVTILNKIGLRPRTHIPFGLLCLHGQSIVQVPTRYKVRFHYFSTTRLH